MGQPRQRTRGRRAAGSLLLLLGLAALALGAFATGTGRWHATPVLSGSMRPGLQPGDVVLTKRVPVSSLQVRDVLVFHPPGEGDRLLVHRIVRLTRKGDVVTITTHGDANTADDPAKASLHLGGTAYRVQRAVPLVGYPAVWLSQGSHGPLTIVLGVVFLVGAVLTVVRKGPDEVPPSSSSTPDDAAVEGPPSAVGGSRRDVLQGSR